MNVQRSQLKQSKPPISKDVDGYLNQRPSYLIPLQVDGGVWRMMRALTKSSEGFFALWKGMSNVKIPYVYLTSIYRHSNFMYFRYRLFNIATISIIKSISDILAFKHPIILTDPSITTPI